MEKEINMFVVTGMFVPSNDTVTILNYKRLKNLDLKFDVFALKSNFDNSIVKELENDEDFKKFNIEYFKNYDELITTNKPYLLILGLFNMILFVYKAIKKFESKPYKYLYTSSIPGISHIIGYFIKKKYKDVIWIASFSDPIYKSPYKNDPNLKQRSLLYQLMFKVGSFIFMNDIFEKLPIKYADKLIFICEHQKNFTLSLYPNKKELELKSKIMPLTYLKNWSIYQKLIENKNKTNTKLTISHLGRLYGLRKIDSLIDALIKLKQEIPNLENMLLINQYSEIQKEDVKKIKQHGLENIFIINPKVNYQQSLEVMCNSDVLLLCDTIMENEKIQPYLPSKIIEYLLLKKPILTISLPNSPAYTILQKYKQNFISNDSEEIKEFLKKFLLDIPSYNYSIEELENSNFNLLK